MGLPQGDARYARREKLVFWFFGLLGLPQGDARYARREELVFWFFGLLEGRQGDTHSCKRLIAGSNTIVFVFAALREKPID